MQLENVSIAMEVQWNSDFSKPPRKMRIGSRNQIVKISGVEGKTFGSSYLEVLKIEGLKSGFCCGMLWIIRQLNCIIKN